MKLISSFCVLLVLLICMTLPAQNMLTFDNQGWSSDQSLDSNFVISNFLYSSNKNFYTNYGYNFDVYNVSLYFVFQNPAIDQFTITTLDNELINLTSLAAYQVSESSTDTLIIEGWKGSGKKYTNKFWGVSTWQILTLNYENINKVVFRLKPSSNENLSDYNFDNFSFNYTTVPVELINFNARAEENYIKLEWQTATELNNYGFDIERKDSETDWKEIGFVKANGTTAIPKNYSFSDNSVMGGYKYKYRLKQIDNNGDYKYSSEIEAEANLIPASYTLSQNYPNPFNPSTIISYQLAVGSQVSLKIYDVLGNEITILVNEEQEAGIHSVNFNSAQLSSGIYFYMLNAGKFSETKSMVLIK